MLCSYIVGYNSNGNAVGTIHHRSGNYDEDRIIGASIWYADRNLSISGENVKISLKKGWNYVYFPETETMTTEPVSGLKWLVCYN